MFHVFKGEMMQLFLRVFCHLNKVRAQLMEVLLAFAENHSIGVIMTL